MEDSNRFPPCTLIEAGEGYVAAQWRRIAVFSTYLSPALDVAQYTRRLDRMGECANRLLLLSSPVLIAGDFNAKFRLCGSPQSNRRGNVLAEWAAVLGLSILNSGTRSTCVRPRGQSIVDLTWVSPLAAHLVSDWRVVADAKSLSDHRYIEIASAPASREVLTRRREAKGEVRRWVLKKIEEALYSSILAAVWEREGRGEDAP